MRIRREHRLLAAACNIVMLVGLTAGAATEQAPPAPSKGDGLLRTELSLGGRTAGLSYSPNLKASDPAHQGLLSASAGPGAVRVRVAQLDTTGAIRIGAVDLGPANVGKETAAVQPAVTGVRYSLWLDAVNDGWQLQVTDGGQAPVGTIPLTRLAAPAASANFVAALIPENSTTGRLVMRWGDYEATASVQFINPSRRRVAENGEPNATTSRTHDEDTSVLSRARLLAERNESALVLPKGSRLSVSYQRTFAKNERSAGNRNRVGLGVDGPDFIGLTRTADGGIVMLTESSVPRLRVESPLRFGKATIAIGNQVVGFPGSYGVWLKRAGAGWRLVFNNEPDVWGSQHDVKSDAAEIDLSHTEGHAADRPFAVALVPTAPDRGRLVIIWGPHEWTAEFTAA